MLFVFFQLTLWNRALLEAATATVKLESPVRKVEKAGCRFLLDQYGEFDAGVCALIVQSVEC